MESEQIIEIYDYNEHKHRFSVWTASRASQRSFTSTKNISKSIDATDIRRFVESNQIPTQKEFDELQKKWCNTLIIEFNQMGKECSYGRASKIISIYLKTILILDHYKKEQFGDIIHPPIDKILLQSLPTKKGDKYYKSINWTQLTEEKYWDLVNKIRNDFGYFNWKIESFWKPEIE
jgi:hypothetical protein